MVGGQSVSDRGREMSERRGGPDPWLIWCSSRARTSASLISDLLVTARVTSLLRVRLHRGARLVRASSEQGGERGASGGSVQLGGASPESVTGLTPSLGDRYGLGWIEKSRRVLARVRLLSLAQLVLDCKTRAGLAGRFQQWQRQSTPSAWTSRPSCAPADGLLLFLFLRAFDPSPRRSPPPSSSRRCRHTHGHAVR